MNTKSKTKKPKAPVFVNAEAMNRQHPDTFEIPESRSALEIGDFAKVCCNGERFWTIIRTVLDGVYIGEVNNHLICQPRGGLKCGDLVRFAPCNVFQAMRGDRFMD